MTAPRARETAAGATVARTRAQAKVNLLLRVLAREESGYHQLETLFCRLELGDDVMVRTNVRGRSLDCAGDAVPAGGLGPVERNLAWRAAVAYAEATGWPNAWAIEIDKRVPVGGGLGGGSADAGGVLRCLNALSPAPLDDGVLLQLAAPLGSDVPFLTGETPLALAWGRGERMLAVPGLPSRVVTLACFAFGVATPDAYRWLDDARSSAASAAPTASMLDLEHLATWNGIGRLAHNDFESIVAPRFSPIAETLASWRDSNALRDDSSSFVMLAGSGSTVFAVADQALPTPDAKVERQVRTLATRTATRVVGVDVSG